MPVTNLRELFEHELKDIYYAEQKLVEALGQLASESQQPQVRAAFESHRMETQGQVQRLEQVFRALGQQPETQVCAGIEGLLKEKQSFSKEKPSPAILEVFNIGAGEKTEHYEISAYQGMIQHAQQLGLTEVVGLLQQNLQEEEAALRKLQSLSKNLDMAPMVDTLGTSQGMSAQ